MHSAMALRQMLLLKYILKDSIIVKQAPFFLAAENIIFSALFWFYWNPGKIFKYKSPLTNFIYQHFNEYSNMTPLFLGVQKISPFTFKIMSHKHMKDLVSLANRAKRSVFLDSKN